MGRVGKKLKMKSFRESMNALSAEIHYQNPALLPEYQQFYEDFEKRFDDPFTIDIKKAYHWFIEYMGHDAWVVRKAEVVKYFRELAKSTYDEPQKGGELDYNGKMAFYDDWVAWYLYLAESLADKPTVDEPSQSSRIWPFFATIGQYKEELQKAKGINSKLYDLLVRRINQPDSILFEFVVAICYIKNGWTVEFIPERGGSKTPDLHVVRGDQSYYVECKRLAKVTQYSEEERTEWLKRWRQVVPLLAKYPQSVFLDVEFKVEVKNTDISIVAEAFYNMAMADVVKQGYCVENDDIIVCAKHMDMKRIQDHFEKWMVKFPSPQLNALFDDEYDPQGSYTSVCEAKLVEIEPDEDNVINIFMEQLKRAYCAKWECTAVDSIHKKAKDVKSLLVKAVNQAPENGSTIIHIGYETLHGPHIEFVRDAKIVELLSKFDFGEKDIASIFCHSFQPRLFANNEWDFAETTRYFEFSVDPQNLLTDNLLMNREGTEVSGETHWEQDILDYI
ncbi:hypothetical protein K6U58_00015 [Vibrio fluvialis]|uniref:hypothetical protein n=1 Tax=Vibrio fluvialis TaxID=676 RepID=UPI001C9CD4E9|nr:hypothetical protein [Vibrio fluvialis]MBY7960070.1 hypothetical protein [Vibrio fluvialis]MCG6356980.1 hypothetical protein [Vibrio fluvialis]